MKFWLNSWTPNTQLWIIIITVNVRTHTTLSLTATLNLTLNSVLALFWKKGMCKAACWTGSTKKKTSLCNFILTLQATYQQSVQFHTEGLRRCRSSWSPLCHWPQLLCPTQPPARAQGHNIKWNVLWRKCIFMIVKTLPKISQETGLVPKGVPIICQHNSVIYIQLSGEKLFSAPCRFIVTVFR